jgi:hypothetical protein
LKDHHHPPPPPHNLQMQESIHPQLQRKSNKQQKLDKGKKAGENEASRFPLSWRRRGDSISAFYTNHHLSRHHAKHFRVHPATILSLSLSLSLSLGVLAFQIYALMHP